MPQRPAAAKRPAGVQDDGHIFCTPEQIQPEIRSLLDLVEELLNKFGFRTFEVNLSTRPQDSIGSDAVWARAESALSDALKDKGWPVTVDEGGGAFYGPKIDIKIQVRPRTPRLLSARAWLWLRVVNGGSRCVQDAIGRKWQCSTIQLDFNLPERFEMEYVDAENTKQRPIMIHRAILGSIERFFGILTENYMGAFPVWLAPVQCRLLPVNAACEEFCTGLLDQLKAAGVRAEMVRAPARPICSASCHAAQHAPSELP